MSVQRAALASLMATYSDSDCEEDFMEDDLQETSNTPRGAAPNNSVVGQPRFISPIPGRSTSNSPIVNSIITENQPNNSYNTSSLVTAVSSRVQRLVSYMDDTNISDDEGAAYILTEGQPVENGKLPFAIVEQSPCRQDELPSDEEVDSYGVVIPPEPPGPCPSEMIEKVNSLFRKVESENLNMSKHIQGRKIFRNPSIYEKLIQFCHIDELGSNYPPERFDPYKWDKDSYYEELAKVQKVEMEKLEAKRKEKAAKIEIVSGLAKRPSSLSRTTDEDAKRRKSKWDQVATGAAPSVNKPSLFIPQPTFATLTSSATGTKATVISAFGSLPRKRI